MNHSKDLSIISDVKLQARSVPAKSITYLDSGDLVIEGYQVQLASTAKRELLQYCNQTAEGLATLDKMGKGAGSSAMRQILKAYGKENKTALMVFEPGNKKISRIVSPSQQKLALTGGKAVELTEAFIAKDPSRYSLFGCAVDETGTKGIIAINDNFVHENKLLPLENAQLGRTMVIDFVGGTSVFANFNRMGCTNQLREPGNFPIVRGLNAGSKVDHWFDAMFNETTSRKIIERYWDAISMAGGCQMSVREVKQFTEHLAHYYSEDAGKWGPVFDGNDWSERYKLADIDLSKLTKDQLGNCPATGVNLWDGINMMTDLASHQYNSYPSDWLRQKTMELAGKVLYSRPDAKAWVPGLMNLN